MSELPNGWTEHTLDELLAVCESGSRPKGGVRGIEHGVPSIGGEHISYSGGFEFANIKYVPVNFAKSMKKGKIELNDILIIKDGATTGKTAIVTTDFPYEFAVVNEHVFICRLKKHYEPKYVFHFLRSDMGQNRILDNFQGSAQGGINKSFVSGTAIPIPNDFDEQHRIVERLEQLLGKINIVNERFGKIPALIKQFRQSVLSAACCGRLTADWRENNICENAVSLIKPNVPRKIEVEFIKYTQTELPTTWIWTAIANYAICSRGRFSIRPRNDPRCYGGKYPFIQIGDLPKNGGLINNHEQTLNDFGLKTSKMFPTGTVVIAIVGATIANTGILAYDMCFPDSLVGMETGTEVGNKYIEYYLRFIKEDIRQISYAGGGQPNIKLKTLEPYPMPLPPFSEQDEIVRRVDMLFGLADKIEARYIAVREMLSRAEKAVYAKAFRGEL